MRDTKIERRGSEPRRRLNTTPCSHLSEPRSWRQAVAPGERRLALRVKRNPGAKEQRRSATSMRFTTSLDSTESQPATQLARLTTRIRWIATRRTSKRPASPFIVSFVITAGELAHRFRPGFVSRFFQYP